MESSSSVGDTHCLKTMEQGLAPRTTLIYLFNMSMSGSGSFDRSLEGSDALCLNTTTAKPRRLFSLPWFTPPKGQMQDFVGVCAQGVLLWFDFCYFLPSSKCEG